MGMDDDGDHDHVCGHGNDRVHVRDHDCGRAHDHAYEVESTEDHVFCRTLHRDKTHRNRLYMDNSQARRRYLPHDGDGSLVQGLLDLQTLKPGRDIYTSDSSSPPYLQRSHLHGHGMFEVRVDGR